MLEGSITLNQTSPKSIACLKNYRKRQLIRIVNPHDDEVEFGFKSNLSHVNISPKTGSIQPRDSVIVTVDIVDEHMKEFKDLNLIYWKDDVTRRRGYIKGLLPISFSGPKGSNSIGSVAKFIERYRVITIFLSFLRPTFILALVIYNIILINILL